MYYRILLSLALAVSLGTTLGATEWDPHATPPPRPKPPAKAPADEYFGTLRMSLLGVNNVFHDVSITAGESTTDEHLMSKADDAADALRAWARKYPNDPQLARSYWFAFGTYRKIYTKDAQEQAWHFLNVIVQRWPSSYFGKLARSQVALGFTEHYYAAREPCPIPTPPPPPPAPSPPPTPQPTPSPTPTRAPRRGLFAGLNAPRKPKPKPTPTPALRPTLPPTPEPTAPPTPTPMPTPSPEVTPLPGRVNVEVLPAPCFTGAAK